jgi:hypothetical protein
MKIGSNLKLPIQSSVSAGEITPEPISAELVENPEADEIAFNSAADESIATETIQCTPNSLSSLLSWMMKSTVSLGGFIKTPPNKP